MVSIHRVAKLRRQNIERSKAAGAAVGEYSELDRPQAPKVRRRRLKRGAPKRVQERKSNSTIRAESDAMFGYRRLPGSFENGKRR
jgi:hypothetical protein